MTIAAITLELQATVDLIHQNAINRKADTYLLCETALKKARELHDDAAFIAIALDYAEVIDLQGYPEYCIDTLYEALQLAQNYHLFHAEGRILIAIGRSVYTRAEYPRAMQVWSRALDVATLGNDDLVWVWAKVGIAQIYDALEDHATAISLLTQAKDRAKSINNSALIMGIANNLGVNLFRINKFDAALDEYRSGLITAKTLDLQDTKGEILFRIAEVYAALNNLATATEYLDQAEVICKKTQYIWALASIRGVRAAIFDKQSNYIAAHAQLIKGIEEAKRSGSTHILMRLYFSLSELAEKNMDFQLSLSAHKSAIHLQNTIFPRNNQQQLHELEDLAELRLSPSRLLLDLSNDTTLNKINTSELASFICQFSQTILKIPQASYWSFEHTDEALTLLIRCRESLQYQSNESIKLNEHPTFFNALFNGETIIANMVQYHQKTWPLYDHYFKPQKISAIIIVPIRVNNELCGILCFEHYAQQHNWSNTEIQFANQLASIMARRLSEIEIQNFITEVAELNTKLNITNDELEQRVEERTNELSSTMAHLIQAEKMAALGQLIAGVAHEINTPISAVKSSGNNIADALQHMLENLPRVLNMMDERCQNLFNQLLSHTAQLHEVLSSREERSITRQLSAKLEAAQIPDAQHKASILVQLHAWPAINDYWHLLQHPQCELILETGYSVATITSNTTNINTAVDRVAKIIFALKSFSRFDQSDEIVEANLRDGLETVLTIYHSQIKQHTELVRNYVEIPPLRCFPDELNQVWTNLIHNALQAMPQCGTLTVNIRREDNEAVVSISDTGTGIPSDIQDKIFTPFFTTKPAGEGSGLGLDIVKKIVDKHHGHIDVASTVGVGTTFTIYLPYKAETI